MVVIAIVFTVIALTPSAIIADHLDVKHQAKGKSERILSSIELDKTSIEGAKIQLGDPRIIESYPSDNSKDGSKGERSYTWELDGLRVRTWSFYDKEKESNIYSVEVWGTSSQGKYGITGRGLELGADIKKQIEVYGGNYHISSTYGKINANEHNSVSQIKTAIIEWSDGTQLIVDYDLAGHISHMQLLENIE